MTPTGRIVMEPLIKFVKLIGFVYAALLVAMIGLVLLSNLMVAMI